MKLIIFNHDLALQGSGGFCYCDLLCYSYGDCCSDIADIGCVAQQESSCVTAGFSGGCCSSSEVSCEGTGGSTSCYCDQFCYQVGDCCNDIKNISCYENTTATDGMSVLHLSFSH